MTAESIRDQLLFVAHCAGRLRVRAETFRVLPEVGSEVAEILAAEPGVLSAHSSPVTGSVLVTYRPGAVELPRLLATIVRAGGLHGIAFELPREDEQRPSQGSRVRAAVGGFNARVKSASRGKIDLRAAVPAALAGTGLAMLALGRRRAPAWYDLLFWSFVTFSSLNPPAPRVPSDGAR